jgi:hypothetical protein
MSMVNDTELVVRMLHAMDGEKVLQAILTEELFRRTYCAGHLSRHASFGWIVTSKRDRTEWYLVLAEGESIPASAVALVQRLPDSHTAYAVEVIDSGCAKPGLSVRVWSLQRCGDGLDQVEERDLSMMFAQQANPHVRSLGTGSMPDQAWLGEYVACLPRETLRVTFARRCIMNYVLQYPKDIDVIELRDGQLTFIEFKRKDPARRYYSPPVKLLVKEYGRLFETMRVPAGAGHEQVRRTIEEAGCVAREAMCYGLDYRSHVSSVLLCHRLRIGYRYVVWNHPAVPIGQLLDRHLRPVGGINLESSEVVLGSFAGFNFNVGKKRGDIHVRHGRANAPPRFQLMIPKSSFMVVSPAAAIGA